MLGFAAGLHRPELSLSQVQRRRRRLLQALFLPAAFLLLANQGAPLGSPSGRLLALVGALAVLLCFLGRLWCIVYIGDRKRRELVREGPYALTRNPLYVFSVLGAFGVGLASGSLTLALLAAAVAFLVFDQVIRREESFLQASFGEAFTRYRGEVPRWLPRPPFNWPGGTRPPVSAAALRRTLRDSSLFLAALPLVILLQQLHATGRLPAFLSLP